MPPSGPSLRGLALLPSQTQALCTRASIPPPMAPCRAFSSTTTSWYRQVVFGGDKLQIPSPTAKRPDIPDYPYGERQVYKQSNTGLYGQARVRFGNTVSRAPTYGRHDHTSRRKWHPNVQSKRLWSVSLSSMVRTRVTARVLRTIDKVGGLDNYLLGTKAQRIKDLGPWGWRLRWRIMQTPAVKEMFARQRVALGLPPDGIIKSAAATLPDGVGSAEELMVETQKMIEQDKEFEIGEPATTGKRSSVPTDDAFMREEKRPSRTEAGL